MYMFIYSVRDTPHYHHNYRAANRLAFFTFYLTKVRNPNYRISPPKKAKKNCGHRNISKISDCALRSPIPSSTKTGKDW